MAKRRRRLKKPRWRMKTVFGKGGGGLDKPLNRGKVEELDPSLPKAGPLDMNKSEPTVRSGVKLIYPPPSPFGYIRPPSTVRPERNFVPTRFLGTPGGRYEAEHRSKQHLIQPIFRVLRKGDTRETRLWWVPGKSEFLIVETDTLVPYRKESIVYTSRQVAELMYQTGKISWERTLILSVKEN